MTCKDCVPSHQHTQDCFTHFNIATACKEPNEVKLCRLHAQAGELAAALKELVKSNEDWNNAVQSTIGRLPTWNDQYLARAKAALAAVEAQ